MILSLQSCISHKGVFKGTDFARYENQNPYNKDQLEELTNYIQDNLITTGLVVLEDGKVVYEYGDLKKVSYIASCRKSVLSMLYGKHIENGKIDLTFGQCDKVISLIQRNLLGRTILARATAAS